MLALLKRRLASDHGRIRETAEQQRQMLAPSWKVVGFMSKILTHVLDTVISKPAIGIVVKLELQENQDWKAIASARRIVMDALRKSGVRRATGNV